MTCVFASSLTVIRSAMVITVAKCAWCTTQCLMLWCLCFFEHTCTSEHTAETAWPVGNNQPQSRLNVNTAIKASQPAAGNKGALIVDLICCERRSEFQRNSLSVKCQNLRLRIRVLLPPTIRLPFNALNRTVVSAVLLVVGSNGTLTVQLFLLNSRPRKHVQNQRSLLIYLLIIVQAAVWWVW